MLEQVFDLLAFHGYPIYAVSLRGHGGSDGRDSVTRATFADYVDDVKSTLAIIAEPVTVIGHSLGGVLARKLMEDKQIQAAVLLSTPTPEALLSASASLVFRYPIKMLKVLFTGKQEYLYNTPEVLHYLFFRRQMPQSLLNEYIPRLLAQPESDIIAFEVMRVSFEKRRDHPPVLVIGGANDVSLKERYFIKLAKFYQTDPVMIPQMPHDMMLDENWEESAAIILEWLAHLSLSSYRKRQIV